MSLNIKEILKYLPHRYPFLLIDRVLELEPKKRIKVLKNVTINEHFFLGHFPNEPVMPGVLIVEAMAQAALVMMLAGSETDKQQIYYLASVRKATFRRIVTPGDQLILDVSLERAIKNIGKFVGTATVDGKKVVDMEFMCSMPA